MKDIKSLLFVAKQTVLESKQQMKENYNEVAKTILSQLGGNKFTTMTGAKNLLSLSDGSGGLSFKLPNKFAKNGINYVKIILNSNDLYDIEFGKIIMKKYDYKYDVIKSVNDVYADQLQEIFTDVTGLDTHL